MSDQRADAYEKEALRNLQKIPDAVNVANMAMYAQMATAQGLLAISARLAEMNELTRGEQRAGKE